MNRLPVLNIIGTGKLGSALGRLLAESGQVEIGALFSRDLEKATQAVRFIGGGVPANRLGGAPTADLWMLSVADDAIQAVAADLAELNHSWQRATVFHCSGINSSELLAPLELRGAQIASMHPAHSFACPAESLTRFSGTYCALEGTESAVQILEPLFSNIGGNILAINKELKPLYHAAMAVASNHLVALLESSLQLLRATGIPDITARAIIEPLVQQSTVNFFSTGAEQALTGPVARGDCGTIEKHLATISEKTPEELNTYLALLAATLKIATSNSTTPAHQRIDELLKQYR